MAWMAGKNHAKEKSVWLILYHADSVTPGVSYNDAVEEAISFGWIDSKPEKRDDESSLLLFSQRKPGSNWSRINRRRAERMISEMRMTDAGMRMVDLAKESGTWTALEEVQKNVIPDDLQKALDGNLMAKEHFNARFPLLKTDHTGMDSERETARNPEKKNTRDCPAGGGEHKSEPFPAMMQGRVSAIFV